MISPGRLLRVLFRDLRRGWGASRRYYRTLPLITKWQWPFWSEKPQPIPVHLLTGAEDWRLAAWALASWFYFSENAWPVVIHDDGTLPAEAAASFRKMFPECRVISRAEADDAVEAVLKPFPFCYEYRAMHPLALKIFDFPHFTAGSRYLVFDSGLLFFNFPAEIMDWVHSAGEECRFAAEATDSLLLSPHEAQEELGVKLWERVNTGLGLIHRAAIDYDFCDRALAQTSMMRGHIAKVEQTLYALCASRHQKGGLLSPRYQTAPQGPASPGAVARLYQGAARDRFFGEGLRRLEPVLLARSR